MLARASLAALFGFLLLMGFSGALRLRFWVMCGETYGWSPSLSLNATRPVPVAAPDATFVTRHVSFEMSAPYHWWQLKNVNNTVESFLASAHPWWVPPVKDLAFSGLYNSVVGAVVDGNTPVVNSTAGSSRHLRHVHEA